MPTSARQKGIDFQNWIDRWILKEFPDSAIHNFKPTSKMIKVRGKDGRLKEIWVSRDNDLWNCIDLEVKMPHCPKPIYIQAKVRGDVARTLEKIKTVPWDLDHQIVQLWQKKKPGRIVIQQLRVVKGDYEFFKIAEIQRGKYVPFVGSEIYGG